MRDYADTPFSNFVIEYLRENKKFHEIVLPYSSGAKADMTLFLKDFSNMF